MPDHKAIGIVALACLLSEACAPSQDPNASESAIAITHVNLIPMDRERVIPDQTVIVQNGRIASIGPADATELPEDVSLVIEGRGRYLMPGLADMHVHLSNDGVSDPFILSLFLANGVTTVRNMHGNPEILEWRGRIEEGVLVGPRIYTTGPILDGEPPYWGGSIAIETPEEAEQEVAAQEEAGYDGIKVLANMSPEAYEAVLAAAARHEIRVYGHAPSRLGLENALNSGQRSFEHMADFMVALLPDDSPVRARFVDMWGDRTMRDWRGLFLDRYEQADRSKIASLSAKAAAAGVWICPTLSVRRIGAADAAEFDKRLSDPTMRYVSPQNRSRWERSADFYTSESNDPTIMQRGLETMLIAVKALHGAGARLVVGTDAPGSFVLPGFSVHEELGFFVEAGLTPFEALAASTRGAAEFLEASDEFGTVQVGRRADLILLKANPLEDVRHTSELAGAMANGSWFSEQELDAMLEDAARGYREAGAEATVPEGRGQ
ncbi:MAG: amidohydrolase family protein [Gemmatimonadota bacterium]